MFTLDLVTSDFSNRNASLGQHLKCGIRSLVVADTLAPALVADVFLKYTGK